MESKMTQNPNCERLFLLEVLVEHLQILKSLIPTNEDGEEEDSEVEQNFCLAVKLGMLPCFEMCHKAVGGELVEEEDNEFMKYPWNEGKNCLFPMTASELARIVDTTPLVLVLRQNAVDDEINSTMTGKTEIALGEEMVQMVREAEHWLAEEPVTEALQDLYTLTAVDDSVVGAIKLVVRLTCLGAAVFTNFEIANRKFKFNKDDKSRIVHKCKACAPGKVVSCADVKGKVTESTELIQPGTLEYDDRATPSVQFLAKPNHSEFACSCSHENLVVKRRITKKPKTITVSKKPAIPIKRRKKLFLAGPLCLRRNAAMRHEGCKGVDPPVPARHGWAWTSTAPVGLKLRRSWIPGYVPSEVRCKIDEARGKRGLPPLDYNGSLHQYRRENDIPTLHIHRKDGQYALTLRTFGPKGVEVPVTVNIARPDDYSDESDVEFEFQLPAEPTVLVAHTETQYKEKDFTPSPACGNSVQDLEDLKNKKKSKKSNKTEKSKLIPQRKRKTTKTVGKK